MNIAGKSPTVEAKLKAFRQSLLNDQVKRDALMLTIATRFANAEPDPKPTPANMKDQLFPGTDPMGDRVDAAMGYMTVPEKLAELDVETKGAIDAIAALKPRERGALYQYTNKLHDQMGYATQSFSMSDDFTPADVASTTEKLRSLRYMLPILQALHSAMEKLPAYGGSKVYSGRKSGTNLTTLDDPGRLNWAKTNFKPGEIISYNYPLSTAKDVDSSFIPLPGTDVGLEIEQPILTGRDIEYLSNKPKEKEVLFPQGVRFQVVRVEEAQTAGSSPD